MKKSQLATALLLFTSLSVLSQNTTPYWSLAGNNNATSASKLGTTNPVPLNLTTNNTTRMRIYGDGKVGIGNRIAASNITRALNIADDNAVLRVLRVHPSFAPAVEFISRTSADGANVAYWDMYAEPSDASFRIRDRIGGGAGLNRMTISRTGLVGIGTTSPFYQLDVAGNGRFTNALTVEDGGLSANNHSEFLGTGITGSGYTGVHGRGFQYGVTGWIDKDPEVTGGTGAGVLGEGYHGVIGKAYFSIVYDSESDYEPGRQGTGLHGEGYTGVYGQGYTGVLGFSTEEDLMTGIGFGAIGYGSGSLRMGVGAYAENSVGLIAGTGNPDSYAGVFEGDIYAAGAYFSSDRKLKQNIADISSTMEVINKLQPKTYEYRQEGSLRLLNLPKGKHYGLIAQDVEQVLPNLVKETKFNTTKLLPHRPVSLAIRQSDRASGEKAAAPAPAAIEKEKGEAVNFKAVNYTELIPLLVKGMQELNKQNEDLKKEVAELKALVSQNSNSSSTHLVGAYLEQNAPNPVRSATTIRYHVAESAAVVRLNLTNSKGQLIKTVNITSRGSGQVNLETAALPAGVYHYTLWVDGRDVDTKQLVISR